MNNYFKINENIYIIAEIGANHNGDIELAFKLIEEAKNAGCDCVKFQSWDHDLFSEEVYRRNSFLKDGRELDGNLRELVEKYSLSFENLNKLKNYCDKINIDFASSVFTHKQIDELTKLQTKFIKIASMDLNYDLLIAEAAKTKLPVILSTGLSTLNEISHAVNNFERYNNKKLVLLHCKAVYPPSEDKIDLNNIDLLKEKFNYSIGFSDHSKGVHIPIAAFTKGCEVFEKHFTLDKNLEGWDHATSADPKEMKQIVLAAKSIPKALGNKERTVFDEELQMSKAFRRSIVAKDFIPKGTKIDIEMLDFKRPGTGIAPNNYKKIINHVTKVDIDKDTILLEDFFTGNLL